MINKNYKKCLILEDDCIFTEELNNFNNIIEDIPDNWELLYLGHSHLITNNNTQEENARFKKLIKGVAETHIYGITLDCAHKLIRNTYPIRAAVDGFLGHFTINNKILQNIYILKTSLGINGSLYNFYKTTL